MYLKSLVLKGFKSFADRSVLNLEPGMTCIVGPNGSGKSNIADAILWVLGERSPKNLRGQSMEDVIFAGSKGRKAVNVAEVTLVLDNSDGAIPVEYTEIELTRRMYRTGGSDYLINGAPARLMDFLNILHDSGLGTGTHSIISQGNLEAILQSKPEDRRALIEEAAGVLKHKQRKEASFRKLELMDAHLARVRDIYGEVARQMGPLERKAKRALTYKELTEEYAGLRLGLAVDDLRALQRRWDEVEAARKDLEAHSEDLKAKLDAAEAEYEELSRALEAESRNREEAMGRRARYTAAVSQIDACLSLLRQIRTAAEGRIAEERMLLATLEDERAKREAEVAELLEAEKKTADEEANAAVAKAEALKFRDEVGARVREAGRALDAIHRDRRVAEEQLAGLRKRLSVSQAEFDSDDHRLAFIKTAIDRAREQVDLLRGQENAANEALAAAKAACEEARSTARAADGRVADLAVQGEELDKRFAALREAVAVLDAELKALAEIERANEEAEGEAAAWVASDSPYKDRVSRFSRYVTPEPEYETACERALGQALHALSLGDDADLAALQGALAAKALSGNVVLLAAGGQVSADAREAVGEFGGTPLTAHVAVPSAWKQMAEALLGDVLVFDSFAQAMAAKQASDLRLRYVSRSGDIICPDGLILLAGSADDPGVLSRRRRAGECASEAEAKRHEMEAVDERRTLIAAGMAEARNDAFAAARAVAVAEGRVRSCEADVRAAGAKVSAAITELNASLDLSTKIEAKSNRAKPLIEKMEAGIAGLEERVRSFAEQYDAAETELNEAREASHSFGERLSQASMALNTAQSALALARSRRTDRERDLKAVSLRMNTSEMIIGRKLIVLDRARDLEEAYNGMAARLDSLHPVLGISLPEEDGEEAGSLAGRTAAARAATRELRASYDGVFAALSDNKVEAVQLKLQVKAAIDVITEECRVPIETAIKLPELDNRTSAEERAGTLKRRISNLGTVSPEATDEYLQVKKRYDFLSGQLADLDEARAALKKIDAVIDARMRRDFVDTFDTVNVNFREIFGILFPGGTAELIFTDPDDPENTGVEVIAQPRGKRITKMMLMSGGEKSLTALALLFAVYRTRTTPFYVLDEVEAALDDTNLRRLLAFLDELRATTQLILITHQRRTMESADVLFGVSMTGDGVTKVISQRLERALVYAEE